MITNTLSQYIFKHALKAIVATFVLCLVLATIADFLGIARRVRDGMDIDVQGMIAVAMLRAPLFAEQIIPFAVLFGAMASLLTLSKRHELVVARSVGVSAWQFLAPVLALAVLTGVMTVAIYNPSSTALFEKSLAVEDALYAKRNQTPAPAQNSRWVYSNSDTGATILNAGYIHRTQPILYRVTAYSYDARGQFVRLIEARKAVFENGKLVFHAGTTLRPGINAAAQGFSRLTLATHLSLPDLNKHLLDAKTLSVWGMSAAISEGEALGVSVNKLRMAYQNLLARPLLLVSMIFIAATVSLRLFRLGGIRRFLTLGSFAGFALYIVTQLASDLGEAGLVSPVLAAWVPPFSALFLGTTVLLYQEDG